MPRARVRKLVAKVEKSLEPNGTERKGTKRRGTKGKGLAKARNGIRRKVSKTNRNSGNRRENLGTERKERVVKARNGNDQNRLEPDGMEGFIVMGYPI